MGSGSLRDASCPSTNIGVEVVRAVATSQRALRFNLNSNSCGRNLENRCQRYNKRIKSRRAIQLVDIQSWSDVVCAVVLLRKSDVLSKLPRQWETVTVTCIGISTCCLPDKAAHLCYGFHTMIWIPYVLTDVGQILTTLIWRICGLLGNFPLEKL